MYARSVPDQVSVLMCYEIIRTQWGRFPPQKLNSACLKINVFISRRALFSITSPSCGGSDLSWLLHQVTNVAISGKQQQRPHLAMELITFYIHLATVSIVCATIMTINSHKLSPIPCGSRLEQNIETTRTTKYWQCCIATHGNFKDLLEAGTGF